MTEAEAEALFAEYLQAFPGWAKARRAQILRAGVKYRAPVGGWGWAWLREYLHGADL